MGIVGVFGKWSRAQPAWRSAGIMVIAVAVSLLPSLAAQAFAVGLQTQGIEMSSAQPGARATYTLSFTLARTSSLEGLVINFCDNTPTLGTSCRYDGSGQSVSVTGATLMSVTGDSADSSVGPHGWHLVSNPDDATAGNGVILALEDADVAARTVPVPAGTVVRVVIAGLTNPDYQAVNCSTDESCTFYARLLAYDAASGSGGPADYRSVAYNAANVVDAGGLALATSAPTAAVITISAVVPEQLTVCVSVAASGSCGSVVGPAPSQENPTDYSVRNFAAGDGHLVHTFAVTNSGDGVAVSLANGSPGVVSAAGGPTGQTLVGPLAALRQPQVATVRPPHSSRAVIAAGYF